MKSNTILTVQKSKGNPECSETTISCWGHKTEELSVIAFSVAALKGQGYAKWVDVYGYTGHKLIFVQKVVGQNCFYILMVVLTRVGQRFEYW